MHQVLLVGLDHSNHLVGAVGNAVVPVDKSVRLQCLPFRMEALTGGGYPAPYPGDGGPYPGDGAPYPGDGAP